MPRRHRASAGGPRGLWGVGSDGVAGNLCPPNVTPDTLISGVSPAPAHQIETAGRRHRRLNVFAAHPWWWVAVLVVALAITFVSLARVKPAFDAYGWIVWGRQTIHLNLDTNSAPSWKPLTFLFTVPFALFGSAALWLWMVTSVAAAFAGAVFAGRVAYRLTGPSEGRIYAPIIAAALAGAGMLGINGYWHFILIFTADAMLVTLCLAAIDLHLCGHHRWAWAMLVLACLGRPEVWPIAGLYLLWAWRAHPEMRGLLLAGVIAIPVLWFGIPALTSRSPFVAGAVASDSATGTTLHSHQFSGVLKRFTGVYEWPMHALVLFALGLAVVRRNRTWLVLFGMAALWVAVEIAFAYHGWPATNRYMFPAAAVCIVLAGAAVGQGLVLASRRGLLASLAAFAVLIAVLVAMEPHVQYRGRLVHNGILLGQRWARQLNRLHQVIAKDGGPARILACGRPVTTISYQTMLAWEVGRNIWDVGYSPGVNVARHKPIVLFMPVFAGWRVQAIHSAPADAARCARLYATTAMG